VGVALDQQAQRAVGGAYYFRRALGVSLILNCGNAFDVPAARSARSEPRSLTARPRQISSGAGVGMF